MDENKLNNQPTQSEEDTTSSLPEVSKTDDISPKTAAKEIPAAEEGAEEAPVAKTPTAEEIPDLPTETENKPTPAYTYKWNYTAQKDYNASQSKKQHTKGVFTYALIMSIAFLVSIVLLMGVLLLDIGTPHTYTPPTTSGGDVSLSSLYDFCHPSYVAISVISPTGGEGAGSGIIMTSNGYICTNYHVIEGASTIKVILSNEKMYNAEFIDGDELNDIAVIKINVSGLTAANIGSSQNSKVGDRVMAIGTPYGIDYRGTMTSGYISALDRQHVLRNESGTVNKVQKLIQTDTSVNPGNSGGPLFNMNGEVIGVVSMKIAGTEYEGMGFAIPIESVIDMISDIIENGKITNSTGGAKEGAALGITGMAIIKDNIYVFSGDQAYFVMDDPETGKPSINVGSQLFPVYIPIDDKEAMIENGVPDPIVYQAPATGIRVEGTTPGFNSDIVLKKYDIIMSANGIQLDTMSTLQGIIAQASAGDKLELEVYRDGQTTSVSVILGKSSTMEE